MICFRDRTWCAAYTEGRCPNYKCDRALSGSDKQEYEEWGKQFGEGGGPVALANFDISCTYYEDLTNGSQGQETD